MSHGRRFVRSDRYAWRVIEGQTILVDRDEDEVHRFNPIGTEIWHRLDGTMTLEEIIEHLHGAFDVDRTTVEHDVTRFVSDLLKREMAEEVQLQAGERGH